VTIEEEKEGGEKEEEKEGNIEIEKEVEKDEPKEYVVNNPFRVITHQLAHIEYIPTNRFEPILPVISLFQLGTMCTNILFRTGRKGSFSCLTRMKGKKSTTSQKRIYLEVK